MSTPTIGAAVGALSSVGIRVPGARSVNRAGCFLIGRRKRVHLPLAPVGGEHDGWPRKWTSVPRPTRSDALVDTGPGLPTVTYDLVITYGDGRSIAPVLQDLRELAEEENDGVTITGLGAFESDTHVVWRITAAPVSITHRREDNTPRRATVSLQLTAVSDVRPKVGKSKKPAKKKAG